MHWAGPASSTDLLAWRNVTTRIRHRMDIRAAGREAEGREHLGWDRGRYRTGFHRPRRALRRRRVMATL